MARREKMEDAFAKAQAAASAAQRRPGIALSAQSPFAPKDDDEAKLLGRPLSKIRMAPNSFSAQRPEGGTRQGTGIFAGRSISALGGNSLLDRWDASGSLTGGKSLRGRRDASGSLAGGKGTGRPTASTAARPAFGSAAGQAAALRPAFGYDPSVTGEDYGGFGDALAMGGGSPDLMQPALIANMANNAQDAYEFEQQRLMDGDLEGANSNG